jgi:hypothetical protein
VSELITLEEIKPEEVFIDGGIEALVAKIESQARAVPVDISTERGRKDCASIAFKIAKLKNGVDTIGKVMVAEWKNKSAKVDAQRRKAWDLLETLQTDIRKPLTDFEGAETNRIQVHEDRIAAILAMTGFDAAQPTAADIQDRLKSVSDVMQRDWEEFAKRATEVADAIRADLHTRLVARQKYDSDQAELQRLRQQQEEIERTQREAKIRADAEASAAKRADEEIAAAKAREETAIRAAQDSKEKAERDARDAAAKAEKDAQEAAVKAERDKAAAIEAERARAAKAKSDEEDAAAKREADTKHRAKINREALAAISIAAGITEDAAKPIVEAIARGAIPHVQIRY